MNLCESCKWYFSLSGGIIGKCKNNKLDYRDHDYEEDGLYYYDSEGWCAHLMVGRKFGCVHHESITIDDLEKNRDEYY